MKPVTIQDIAAAAGVSKATVSRVLNGTTAVNDAKRQAVLDAIDRLGFKPNVVAQNLATGRSMTIGVLTQNFGSPFYDAISQGVIEGLADTGYSPIFVDGQWQREVEMEAIRALIGRRVDGLVLIGGDIPESELSELCGDLPALIVARQMTGARYPCIFTDNVDGGYRGTRFLLDQGHRDIALILGLGHHPDAIDRFEGYKKALEEAEVEVDPNLVLEGDFTAESGVRAIEDLLVRKQSFTAVFASNDTTAMGARLALYRHNLRVPEDVSLMGFDDQAEAAFMAPPLTTIRQPAREMGAQASQALLDLIDGKPFASQALRGELQLRESVVRRA